MRTATLKSPRHRTENRLEIDRFLRDSLKRQWRDYRKEFERCQEKFSDDAVHKVRIAIRRLLASLDLLDSILPAKTVDQARRALKKRLKLFARLRDTHAQALQIAKLLHAFPVARRYHAALDRREHRLIQRLRRRLSRTKDKRLTRSISMLKERLRTLARDRTRQVDRETAVRTALRCALMEVKKRRRAIRADDTRTIHRTRVAFKKFRYMIEALERWLRTVPRRTLEIMRDYQTRMGDIQDTEVLLAAIDKFTSKQGGGSKRWSNLRAKLLRRRDSLVRRFVASADKLDGFLSLPSSRTAGRNLVRNARPQNAWMSRRWGTAKSGTMSPPPAALGHLAKPALVWLERFTIPNADPPTRGQIMPSGEKPERFACRTLRTCHHPNSIESRSSFAGWHDCRAPLYC